MILALLEAVRAVDQPDEHIPDEDIRHTMPRRLGVSGVMDTQISAFREHVRKGRRVNDQELASFFGLVARRPDSSEVFAEMGSRMAAAKVKSVSRLVPRPLRARMVRRRIQLTLDKLFGRRMGGFTGGSFTFEATATPMVQLDPSGSACSVITGFCERALHDSLGVDVKVECPRCEARGDAACRWTADPD